MAEEPQIPQQVAPLGEQHIAPAEIGGNDGNVVNAPQENLEVIFNLLFYVLLIHNMYMFGHV